MSTRIPGPPKPTVFPPYPFREAVWALRCYIVARVAVRASMPPPKWLQRLVMALLLVNIRSFPLLWHFHVFYPAVKARLLSRPSIHPLLPFLRSSRHALTTPGFEPRLRLDTLPIRRDIFTDYEVVSYRATPDDCDWNLHLSNSSYAKNLDSARMHYLSPRFIRFHFDGGHLALGGSSFAFHREVPFMARYDVVLSVEAWDEKWCYMVARFVSPARLDVGGALRRSNAARAATKAREAKRERQRLEDQRQDELDEQEEARMAKAEAAAAAEQKLQPPLQLSPPGATASEGGVGPGKTTDAAARRRNSLQHLQDLVDDVVRAPKSAAQRKRDREERRAANDELARRIGEGDASGVFEGRTLYCTAVSRYCFKSGRKTIPPWFVIATGGWGTQASTRSNWEKAEALRRATFQRAALEHAARHGHGSSDREPSSSGATKTNERLLPRDNVVYGGGYRRAGIAAYYDPTRPEGAGQDDVRGLGAWQDKASWELAEFEDRARRNREVLKCVGGVFPDRAESEELQRLCSESALPFLGTVAH